MAQKKTQTDEELLASLEALDNTTSSGTPSKSKAPKSSTTKPPSTEDDPLAELESLAARAKPTSRPATPKLALNQQRNATPGSTPGNSARNSEDNKARANASRKSGESMRSYHQGLTPTSEEDRAAEEEAVKKAEEEKAAGGGWGGWWGGLTATASAAVKQAEAAVKEIQKNEEAQKWTEQFKGRVGDLRGLGMYTFVNQRLVIANFN